MVFRVGITSDLKTASGQPCFNPAAFEELNTNPDIQWDWLDAGDEITADHAAAFDALHVNLPRVTAASVGRDDRRLKVVARNGVGYDTVDVAALAAKGVITTNTPLAVRRPVAVATLTLIFSLTSKVLTKDRLVRAGKWNERVEHMGLGLTTRTLGVIGAGSIGRELMGLARPFFREIIYADPVAIDIDGARQAPLDGVLTRSDVVVVACLLTQSTRHLIDAAALAKMKPTAFFVNVARGPIHDEEALITALEAGAIAGAGLDVTEQEPVADDNPLLTMDNTIITAHSLCWTDECFEAIARSALRSIVDVSQGRHPAHAVSA